MRLAIAGCTVDDTGHLTAHLREATRLIMVRADGTLAIHSDGLYTKPTGLLSDGTGSAAMGRLGVEYDQRMLANGYCNRLAQLDCLFESICETCIDYTTDTTFNPVLPAQRDHAAERDQHARADLFQMLLDRNLQQATP